MRRAHGFVVLLVVTGLSPAMAPTDARAADAVPSLESLRHAYADRLAALGEDARGAHLGALALRLFDDANALAPDQPVARAALGWTRDGSGWKPPVNVIPGDGWADDGEPELARLEKKESQLRADFVKQLVAAAAAAKTKKLPADRAEELLWAAVAIDPSDPAPRKALGHREIGGRFVAPEHETMLAAGLGPTPGDEALASSSVETTEAASPVQTLAGWPDPVPKGAKAPTAGQVHSLSNTRWVKEGAAHLERARRWLEGAIGAPGEVGAAYAFVHAGSLAVARTLVTSDPNARGVVSFLGFRPILVLGNTGLVLAVGETPLALFDGLVTTRVENDLVARAAGDDSVRWLGECAGVAAAIRLLGTTVGFAATTQVFAGVTGPIRRVGEPLPAFVRRLVATGSDPGLEALATQRDRRLYPRELLVGGFVVDWLLRRDAPKGAAFLSTYLASKGGPAERLTAAATAAGFASTRAVDEAFRRFVADLEPVVPSGSASKSPWKIAQLSPMKTVGLVTSLYVPQFHRVSGQLWLGGRPYACDAPVAGGPVRFRGYGRGDGPRTSEKDGEFPFSVAREYGGGDFDVRVELSREGEHWVARRAEGFEGSLDGHPVAAFDLDVDGRFGSFGRDGLVFDHADRPVPLERELALGSKVYEIRRVGPDGRELAWRSKPTDAKGPELEAWLALNDVRLASGLPGLVFDAESAMGTAMHASYLFANHGLTFTPADASREDSTKTDATVVGARVAGHCLAADEPTPRAAIRRWLASPREAALLLDPDARRGAIGTANGVVVFVTRDEAHDAPSEFRGPLVYPSADVVADPGACGVDLVRSDRSFAGSGCPILVRVSPGRVELLSCRLELAGAEVATVRFDATSIGMAGLVALVPKAPLKPATKYQLVVETKADGVASKRLHVVRTADK